MDSRFYLKVEFEIYGKKFENKCSLNWSGYEGEIDRRITEMFVSWHHQAKAAYDEQNIVDEALRKEQDDRRLYKSLKARFEPEEIE